MSMPKVHDYDDVHHYILDSIHHEFRTNVPPERRVGDIKKIQDNKHKFTISDADSYDIDIEITFNNTTIKVDAIKEGRVSSSILFIEREIHGRDYHSLIRNFTEVVYYFY